VSSNALQRFVGTRFRRIITGNHDGVPPWLDEVARGDEAGFYTPADAPWVVHADFATLIGGIRALLMQTLHPATLAGVAQHSRYETDAIGRLAGTTRWLTISTFASVPEVMREAERVNAMHERVRGKYVDANGASVDYQASQSDLLLWVHMAFTESFLVAHETYSARAIPGGADTYVRQWAASVAPLGLTEAPQTVAELEAAIETLADNGVLRVSDTTLRVVEFLKRPPLSPGAAFAYRILFACAVVTLPQRYRLMLKLPAYPRAIVVPFGRGFLRLLRVAVGPESPIEDAALSRLERISRTK
jgi:uncharacterized protein (DUF2236 family)